MKSQHISPPQLAAPGAGLPKIERFVANLMIRSKAARTTREQAAAVFEKSGQPCWNYCAITVKRLYPNRC
ncbi:MAG: hypothetical protein HC845_01265 [Akkermansiaceae bacterium]|nr:hypothetical protein [Akkermansiaceae bacterium]